jgi:hypothetical protein
MDPIKEINVISDLDVQIEELEDRIAPDGGETVLPLPVKHGGKH